MNTQIQHAPRALVVTAFAVIYVVWGSTYLAIRVVVETLPPFLSSGFRFVVAGGVLLALLRLRGFPLPRRAEWRHATITGGLLLLGGNGLVAWAEQSISSGLTALLVALTPVWFALIDWLRPGGGRPQLKTVAGIIVGFIGIAMLTTQRHSGTTPAGHWLGALAVMIAGISWAGGSLYSKYNPSPASPWINAAAQMLCGGIGLLIASAIFGEPFSTNWSGVSGQSIMALMYLIVVGSWIGFSAYVYLLKVSPPSRVSTYAYVNPVIAVFLGWVLLDEIVTAQMFWGMVVIVAGVIVITLPSQVTMPMANQARRQLARVLNLW